MPSVRKPIPGPTESEDIDHDETQGGDEGTPHDHANPGDSVEDFSTTGDSGTVPTSQGDGTLAMEEGAEPTTTINPNEAVDGGEPTAGGSEALAIGVASNTLADGDGAAAIGNGAEASSGSTIALGRNAEASGGNATALGENADAPGSSATALGRDAEASGFFATALGNSADASGDESAALGRGSTALETSAIALGRNAEASGGDNGTALGHSAKASNTRATAIGSDAEASGTRATALGRLTEASDFGAVALGNSAEASGLRATAIGRAAEALTDDSGTLGVATDDFGPSDWTIPGDFHVQGSKDFQIPHPSDPENKDLRHGAYEGPVAGGLIYNATVTADDKRVSLRDALPDYVVNGDFGRGWTCHVTASDHFGRGYVDTDEWVLVVDEPGDYEVTIFGERDDAKALNNGRHRTEKPKGDRWNGEPNIYYRDHPRFDADNYDDIERIETRFEHTEDCPAEPCVEAMDSVRVTFDDGEREEMDVSELGTMEDVSELGTMETDDDADRPDPDVDEVVKKAREQHRD